MNSPFNRKLFSLLFVSTAFSVLLVIFRIHYTSYISYIFLIWNLILAWIPYLCTLMMKEAENTSSAKYTLPILAFFWFLFFPNAPYIITDLFHLKQKPGVPLWFDLILILSAGMNGLLLGFLSLYSIHNYLRKFLSPFLSWSAVAIALGAGSFGIYVGRFLRWNSWDVFNNPQELFDDIFERVTDPFAHPTTVGVTVLFFVFLAMGYLIIHELIHPKNDRFHKTAAQKELY